MSYLEVYLCLQPLTVVLLYPTVHPLFVHHSLQDVLVTCTAAAALFY